MKKIKLILILLSAISLFGVNSVNAQADNEQQFVIIEVIESVIGLAVKPEMFVIDNNGKIISSELEKVSLRNYSETSGKNTITVHNEIKKWTEIGYKILTYDKETGDYLLTTIVLVKD